MLPDLLRPVEAGRDALSPLLYQVVGRRADTVDVTTLSLEPISEALAPVRPGQFNMLTAFGIGEAAISVSSDPDRPGPLEHTIRKVGPVTRSLGAAPVGQIIGVRGPFGTDWGVDAVDPDSDVVVVAGGIGLAPLRGALHQLVRRSRTARGRVHLYIGARSPEQIIYSADLAAWSEAGARVAVTVDVARPSWTGHVGVVTSLLSGGLFDAGRATALVCGPEIMMRFTARSLMDAGIGAERILLSVERNMQCGVGWCGHCQLGPYLLCRDGPVLPYAAVAPLLSERER